MKTTDLVRGAAMSLAALGLMMPQTPAMAQSGRPASGNVAKSEAKLAADIVLIQGSMNGRVVDHTGTPLKNREVVLKQGDKEVAKTTTNDKGVFTVANVRPGNYTATAGNTSGNFRVWAEKTAPPAAKGHALLVMGQNGARGQFGAVDPTLVLLTSAIIASVIISAITLDKVNSVDDKVDQIANSIN